MSRELVTLVYKRRIGSVHRKAILAHCADKASDNGKGIWASKKTIADETECGRSTVIKIMAEFVTEGILIPVGRHEVTNGATIVYDMNIAAVEALPRVRQDRKKPDNPSTSGTSPDQDQSTSGTPTSPPAGREGSTSGTLTVLEPSLEPRTPYSPPFEEFWSLCPKKAGKGDAEKAYAKAIAKYPASEIMDGMRRYAKQVEGKGQEFIKHPSGWLNGRRWEDEEQQENQNERTGNDIATRAAERWSARQVDSGPGTGSSQPLLSAGQPSRCAGSRD